MAAQANFAINDGKATPVSHTFVARGATDKVATWKETAGGIPIGFPIVTLSVKETAGNEGKSTVDYRFSLPVMEVISGADGGYTPSPKVAYTLWGTGTFILPNRSTIAERKDLLALVKNLLAQSIVTSAVQDTERPF